MHDSSGTCAACEQRVCLGEAGKGKPCKSCVLANDAAFEAARCHVGGQGGRNAFVGTFCGA